MLSLILLIVSVVCACIAMVQPTSPQWHRLIAASLAALAGSFLVVRG